MDYFHIYRILELVKKVLLKYWDRKNKFRIFSHKMPKSKKLILQNISFIPASISKINSAIIYDRKILCP